MNAAFILLYLINQIDVSFRVISVSSSFLWTEREFHPVSTAAPWRPKSHSSFVLFNSVDNILQFLAGKSAMHRLTFTTCCNMFQPGRSHFTLCMSVWAPKPCCSMYPVKNALCLSLPLSAEEPKLVQRKSDLVFYLHYKHMPSVWWMYMCAGVRSRHAEDSWKSLWLVFSGRCWCRPWSCLLEHQVTTLLVCGRRG